MPSGQVLYPLGVEWTLIFEIFFYVLVGLLILFKKQNEAITCLTVWLLATSLHNLLRPDDPSINLFPPFELPFVSLNVAFAAGMLLPLVLKRHTPHPVIAILIGLNAFYMGAYLGVAPLRWGLGFGAGLIVLSLASWQPHWRLPGQRILDKIGDRGGSYTYALYLIHVPVIRTIYLKAGTEDFKILFALAVVVPILLCIPFGIMDNYIYRHLKRKSDRSSRTIKFMLSFGFVAAFILYTIISGFSVD
jgi:peptidoglycan/LPS O-acetylase OafA/YrhL